MRAPWELNRRMFLSEKEAALLLRHVRAVDSADETDGRAALDRVLIELLLLSGLRCSELCKLRLGDSPAVLREPTVRVVGRASEGRTVWLPRETAELIRVYARDLRPRLLPEDVDPRDAKQPLIFHERRRPFERSGLYRRVVAVLSQVGLESRASVQLLRHTYGYLAYLGTGGNLLFVQRQLGHAHPAITAIYAQFVEESSAELASRVRTIVPVEPPTRTARAAAARTHRG